MPFLQSSRLLKHGHVTQESPSLSASLSITPHGEAEEWSLATWPTLKTSSLGDRIFGAPNGVGGMREAGLGGRRCVGRVSYHASLANIPAEAPSVHPWG